MANPTLNVVLFQPEIPQNTGNIGRTCVALQAKLWIVRPTGFRLDATSLQRAGLDYWQYLDWEIVDSWELMQARLQIERAWFFTKFATKNYTDVQFQAGDWLIFGCETSGLPESVRNQHAPQCLKLPMPGQVRSLNLAVTAGIALYEAYRQIESD